MALLELFFKFLAAGRCAPDARRTSDAQKYGQSAPPEVDPAYVARIPDMDANTLGLHFELPRGVNLLRPGPNREQSARWANQAETADLRMLERFVPG